MSSSTKGDSISSTEWVLDDLITPSTSYTTGIDSLVTGTVSYIDPTLKVISDLNRSNEALLKAFKSIAIGKPDVYARKIVKYYLEMDRLAPTEKLEELKKDLIDMGLTGL